MALFKSRRGGDEPVAPPVPTESVEAIRRRARHRLIGAVVLVLAGVVGFPLLFDTQPRPVAVDIPIDIPDRNKVKPLTPPPAPSAAVGKVAPAASAPVTKAEEKPAPVVAAPAGSPASAPKVAERIEKPETRPEPKPEPKVAKAEPARPQPRASAAAANDGEKARALLEGKTVDGADAAAGRFVVQVGAFSDPDKAREARQKVERAGLKTYTNVAETKEGKRIRVRAGPFASRAEADKAAEKIKGLDLPAAILSL
ncbi:SPOR domain-containing protein [Caenimonas sedimenti]|uniref:SPOR domain-containing protein n=1 Tax=Caenimonas sedimenti TaxID=2596921 RepID=A0A562ZWY8_9BURK|nr:SPOR domain-containing protein [Caenimonas sedimenti]TWO72973.1 SPOR domain-containing protein [Caenimonas sedimenti]